MTTGRPARPGRDDPADLDAEDLDPRALARLLPRGGRTSIPALSTDDVADDDTDDPRALAARMPRRR